MGLLDGYLDPEDFRDSGGLLGRLLSLQQEQGQYQPGPGFDLQSLMGSRAASAPQTPLTMPPPSPTSPNGAPSLAPETSDAGPARNIAIGDYQMPQFGRADVLQAAPPPPDLGDRLSAGFQSWAHTPVGNPFAAIANGITGFNAGQRTNSAGVVPAQTPQQGSAQPPDLGDRLSAGFQSWAHTPVGNPIAGIANGITGLSSGQRTDPAGIVQRMVQPQANTSANAAQDMHSQYQALRPLLGDRGAMLATVHPEAGRTLVAQALAGRTKSGNGTDADPAANGQIGVGNEASSTAGGLLNKVGYIEIPANANQAFGELSAIQDRNPRHTISKEDHVSGVRDGNVTRNPDGSLDVTNGSVLTLSYKDGHAKTVTVTNDDIAHIDGETGEVVIQKSPLGNGI